MSLLKRLAIELTPPAFRRVAGSMRRRGAPSAGNSQGGRRISETVVVPDLNPKGLGYLIGEPVFSVPMERVRYSNGRSYTHEEHHFIQYYREGLAALRRFYEHHQPVNIFEHYFLKAPAKRKVPRLGAPWFRDCRVHVPQGEGGLGLEHGQQAYGPVSEAKLLLEARRLDSVLGSIQERGFQPEMGGYVTGYFMLRTNGRWVFTIRGGFHRTAALAHLGYRTIEVQFFRSYPRFVEEVDSLEWPMVKSGELTQADALVMFQQFFRSR
jgi:hypothetical protein